MKSSSSMQHLSHGASFNENNRANHSSKRSTDEKTNIYSQANDSVSFLRFRRAHLKECFETLKKNVPNVDEKKTSNLSVLRSALRYIQVHLRHIFSAFPPVFNTPVRRDTIVWTLLATCFSSHCFHLSLVLN